MLLPLKDWIFREIADEVFVAHLEKKIKLDVVEPDKIGSKFKSALEKQGMLKDIKGADYIVRFAEKIEAQPPADEEKPEEDTEKEEAPEDSTEETPEENSKETDSKEETPEETPEDNSEEDSKEETPDEDSGDDSEEATDDSEEDDDKKKDKEEVNESMKIQDLTKSMLLPVKGSSKKAPKASAPKASPKNCTKKEEKCTKCEKKCAEKKTGKSEKKEVKKVEEAETQVTGDELKIKVQKAVGRVFGLDKDKLELIDVPDCVDGYNVYYFKITFQERENQVEED